MSGRRRWTPRSTMLPKRSQESYAVGCAARESPVLRATDGVSQSLIELFRDWTDPDAWHALAKSITGRL